MMDVHERLRRWYPYWNSSGWLGEEARTIIPELLNELAEAGGHGVDLSKMSRDEIRERLFGDATKPSSEEGAG